MRGSQWLSSYGVAPVLSGVLGGKEICAGYDTRLKLRLAVHLSPLRTKLIKCHFNVCWEPLWAWVCSVFDGQDAINELMSCVLDG